MPVVADTHESQAAVLFKPVGSGAGCGKDALHGVVRLLHDQLSPDVHRGELAPSFVDLVHVDGVVDFHELEQVEQEQRDVGIGTGGHVSH
jgi:hypothetical protein